MSVSRVRILLIVVAAALLVLDGRAIALLLSPGGRSRAERQQERDRLQAELQAKMRELGPAQDIDKRLAEAKKEQQSFYNGRIPSRYSEISEAIGKLANQNHVHVATVRYDAKAAEVADLQQVEISMQVVGDYADQMRFINSLERAKQFFVINSVNLGGGEAGSVRLDMRLETFLRSATS